MTSHVRMAREASALHATRIAAGEADALIGRDVILAAGMNATEAHPRTRAVIPPICRRPPISRATRTGGRADGLIDCRKGRSPEARFALDAQRLAAALLGDAIASNMFMLVAWRRASFRSGGRRSTARSSSTASRLRPTNRPSIGAGALPMIRPASRRSSASTSRPARGRRSTRSLTVASGHLTEYRNAAYAERYRALVERARAAEEKPAWARR